MVQLGKKSPIIVNHRALATHQPLGGLTYALAFQEKEKDGGVSRSKRHDM